LSARCARISRGSRSFFVRLLRVDQLPADLAVRLEVARNRRMSLLPLSA
jgi:hypothetical protein